MGNLIGYARVSTLDQNPQLQLDALDRVGCVKTFTDLASGSIDERPELNAALSCQVKSVSAQQPTAGGELMDLITQPRELH